MAVVKRDVEKRIAHIKNDTSIWKALDTSRVLVEKNVAAKERNASTFLQILRVQNPELRNLYVVRTSTKEVLYTFTPASTTYTQNKKYTFFESTGLPANIFQKGTLSRIVRNDSTGMYSVYVLQHSPTLTFTGFSIIQEISIDYFVQVLTSQKSITHLFENNFDIHNQGTTTATQTHLPANPKMQECLTQSTRRSAPYTNEYGAVAVGFYDTVLIGDAHYCIFAEEPLTHTVATLYDKILTPLLALIFGLLLSTILAIQSIRHLLKK